MADSRLVYIGTYTGGGSKGIYAARYDSETGALNDLRLAAETQNPTFLALHPRGKHLYAVGEVGNWEGEKTGTLAAFEIGSEGSLRFLNRQVTKGPGTCHVSVDRSGRCVAASNYSGGSVALFPIQSDGSLGGASGFSQHEGSGPHPKRQQRAFAHSSTFDPTNKFVFTCDLGIDKVLSYRVDPGEGTLEPNEPPFARLHPGAGPRHMAFHPDGRFAYVINELDCTLTVFGYDAEFGALTELQTVAALPAGTEVTDKDTCADIHVHPNGRFVYGSNRGHDSIVVYAIDSATGKLAHVMHESTKGQCPRNFALDPDGQFLLAANQNSDSIVSFRLDDDGARLTPAGKVTQVAKPVCIAFGV
ncbi:MAG: lactonase family protein [Planctomycetota bacterium]|nr:lactonase family protein [Planctomycetota bacterium]